MKRSILLSALLICFLCNYAQQSRPAALKRPAAIFIGSFEDDYETRYDISDTLWVQLPGTKFHIIKWNREKQYIIAKNDGHNPGDKGLYTRIDYMTFTNTEPWKWGYCLTAYNASTDTQAEATAAADREHPMKGCNGFPFSRMKRKSD